MITVTVGTQEPFDRLIRAIDQWLFSHQDVQVFAQIGRGVYRPVNMTWKEFVDPDELSEKMKASELVVAHAGMGTILTALEMRKPLVVMPRDHLRGEHRNAHQLATARYLESRHIFHLARNEHELLDLLDRRTILTPPPACGVSNAYRDLVQRISAVIAALGSQR